MKRFRLSKAADTPIGDGSTRGVSGGERKRTAIGQELVGNPEILFLDEPTSGLDSNSAFAVMENVKNDAIATGRIVICTIHQPSFPLLSLFHRVILLSGGSTVYAEGPLEALDYFAKLGYPCTQPHVNPAEFFMDLLTIDTSKSEDEVKKDVERIEHLQLAYKNRLKATETVRRILLKRAWTQHTRGKTVIIAFYLRQIVLVILIGFTFFQVKNDQKSIQNRLVLTESFTATTGVVITAIPLYFMIRLRTDDFACVVRFVIIQWLEAMCCVAVGFLIGAAVPSLQLGQILAPLCGVVFLLYGGSLLNNEDLPVVFRGFQFISPVDYAYRANMFNEFQGLKLTCSSDPGQPCFTEGDQVLKQYALTNYNIGICMGVLFGLFIGYLAIAYSLLRFLGKPKTKLV
ncbi:hypothetical protein HDU96_005411 [Phlyctochytrium bullatum]|nr:hypothetical protein HDU96_005411 [Phlyctochytrium bullatum]